MPSEKTDIWMPLYIGDYLADTSHLDAERHGCYLLWMFHYWRKGPLTANLDDLISIGRLRSENASSIAQALLGEFFTLAEDSRWHQKRQDAEREKWQQKKLSAVEKAKKAAAGRWHDASSMSGALLEPCPLPSPLPKEQIQKPSRVKRERAPSDERHAEFKEAIRQYWNAKNAGIEMPWGPMEGKQLGMWLREAPHITLEQFKGFLRGRFKSTVNHGERPSQWIRWITSYGNGPIDRFNKPMEEGYEKNHQNGSGNGASPTKQRVDGARRALAEIAVKRGLVDPAIYARANGAAVSEPGSRGCDTGIHDGSRTVSPEILPPQGPKGS